jgi:GH24 family phage-related lysozyme (muramidase)
MTELNRQQIASRLCLDEGNFTSVEQDTRGYWTLGNGFLVDKRAGGSLPEPVRAFWLDYLITKTIEELVDYPSLAGIDVVRKQLVVCLLYNMGERHLNEFKNMLADLTTLSYSEAADQLANSAWYREVGVRGPLYVRIMRTGIWE